MPPLTTTTVLHSISYFSPYNLQLLMMIDVGGGIGFDYIQVCNTMCMYKDIRVTHGATQ
jgi:hypothetical protein